MLTRIQSGLEVANRARLSHIKNVDVSRLVPSHSAYCAEVELR